MADGFHIKDIDKSVVSFWERKLQQGKLTINTKLKRYIL